VRNGDVIELDTERRRLHLEVADAELARRKAEWQGPPKHLARGYYKLYVDHVMQANLGADLDFLVGKSGAAVPRDNH
jgi:dihydroxy-acid dehydratase